MAASPSRAARPGFGTRLGHLPALDGLRAVAVIAVFLFHAGVLRGGFIGVDVFFVVSGFLITALAISEIERTGRLGLGAFWARRARRLLPAVLVMCGAVVVASAALGGAAARRVGSDVISTLAYVANWTQVGAGRDYFATYEDPALLEHTWSLAVEEQFYVVWPLVLVAIVWATRKRPDRLRPVTASVAGVIAIVSVGVAWAMASRGVQLNRLYYGTDARAVGLAIGAVAACVLARGDATGSRRVGAVETTAALAGLAVLVGASVTLDGGEQWLYGPGFLAIALASLALVTAASGTGIVQEALSNQVLVAIGRVSYGIYLWHWPVIVLLDTERTGLHGPALGAVWVGATAVLTVGSWFLVEQRSLPPAMAHPWRTVAYGTVALTVALGATATVSAERTNRPPVAFPDAPSSVPVSGDATPVTSTEVLVESVAPDTIAPESAPADSVAPVVEAANDVVLTTEPVGALVQPPLVVPEGRPLRVLILGDSVAESLNPVPVQPFEVAGVGEVLVRNDAVIGCPILRIGRWVQGGEVFVNPSVCDGDDRFVPAVTDFQPDVLLLLFGWPATNGGRLLDNGNMLRPCQREFDNAWADEYELLVRRFEGVARVIVSTVAPPVLVLTEHIEGWKCLNLRLADRGLTTFDYSNWICPDGDCARFGALRSDTVHFDDADDIRIPVLVGILETALGSLGRPVSE